MTESALEKLLRRALRRRPDAADKEDIHRRLDARIRDVIRRYARKDKSDA